MDHSRMDTDRASDAQVIRDVPAFGFTWNQSRNVGNLMRNENVGYKNISKLELDMEDNALPVQPWAAMEQRMMSHISALLEIQSQTINNRTEDAILDNHEKNEEAFLGIAE